MAKPRMYGMNKTFIPNSKAIHRKKQSTKCPKCGSKLVESEWCQQCRRCGYSKHREPSNLTKQLMWF